jgi:hypothetical protein
MPNPHLLERLAAVQAVLLGIHRGGGPMSSSTKGREREHFIHEFLEQVLPPLHRFGSGDITDSAGQRSGQCDIVIEHPLLPSLPLVGGKERLYLAEGVAAVIEVKSDIASQWDDVVKTAGEVKKLTRPLRRDFNPSLPPGQGYGDPIPVFAVGYKGWSQLKTLQERLDNQGLINGVLIIDGGLFASTRLAPYHRAGFDRNREYYGITKGQGPMGLWGFLCTLQQVTHGLTNNGEWIRDYLQ